MLNSNNYYVMYEFVIEDGSVFVFSDIFHLLVKDSVGSRTFSLTF
jgi:hypothetical protein